MADWAEHFEERIGGMEEGIDEERAEPSEQSRTRGINRKGERVRLGVLIELAERSVAVWTELTHEERVERWKRNRRKRSSPANVRNGGTVQSVLVLLERQKSQNAPF